jgi:Tfp pilus assembly protein PilX
MCSYGAKRERGVITIFIAMIMLVLITLLVVAAFSLSTTNLRAVGNVQARDEAIAAAQSVIEQILGEDIVLSNVRTDEGVDINGDGTFDYLVNVPEPVCVRATQVSSLASSSVTLPGFSAVGAWNTVWEINAVATAADTGARVSIIQAVRVLLDQTQKDLSCPDP